MKIRPTPSAENTLGVVLVGGEARRMNHQPKHLMRLSDGRTMMTTIHDLIVPLCARVVLVGHALADDPNELPNCERIADRDADRHGPMAGIAAGLDAAGDLSHAIIAPCDVPRLTPDAFARLLTSLREHRAACFAVVGEDRFRPLPLAIRCDERDVVTHHLNKRILRVRTLLNALNVHTVSVDDASLLTNINDEATFSAVSGKPTT